MKVELIAKPQITPEAFDIMSLAAPRADVPSHADYLAEFAGRACYQSFHRPREATARNSDYLHNVIDKGHESILEHASFTFYVTGVSRSLTHELIRHRHLSFSELSQRYVDVERAEFIDPPAVQDNDLDFFTVEAMGEAIARAKESYHGIVRDLSADGLPRKQAREAARCVMPNATETRIVVTGNVRAWRHVIQLRGSEHADAEIREFALNVFDILYEEAPGCFSDFGIITLPDGREVVE